MVKESHLTYAGDVSVDDLQAGEVWLQNADYYWHVVAVTDSHCLVFEGNGYTDFPAEAIKRWWPKKAFLESLDRYSAHRGRRDKDVTGWAEQYQDEIKHV